MIIRLKTRRLGINLLVAFRGVSLVVTLLAQRAAENLASSSPGEGGAACAMAVIYIHERLMVIPCQQSIHLLPPSTCHLNGRLRHSSPHTQAEQASRHI